MVLIFSHAESQKYYLDKSETELTRSSSRTRGNVFFHSVSRLNRVAANNANSTSIKLTHMNYKKSPANAKGNVQQ